MARAGRAIAARRRAASADAQRPSPPSTSCAATARPPSPRGSPPPTAFAADRRAGEAAVERLAIANQRRLAPATARRSSSPRRPARDADRAGRLDLRVRALGLEGMARAKRGDYERGLETVRGGLALALEHDLTAVAAELYQRLSVTLYESADYRRAEEALDTALELCRTTPDAGCRAPASPAWRTCCASAASGRGRRRSAAR